MLALPHLENDMRCEFLVEYEACALLCMSLNGFKFPVMSLAVEQITLYTVCIPIILILCLLAAVCNALVLLARFQIKNRSSALELTFSLAASDTWTSIVVAASLFRNSYMPVVLGIHYSSICFPLTLEVSTFPENSKISLVGTISF